MNSLRNRWASGYQIDYSHNGMIKWINIQKTDGIICKECIQMGPGDVRVFCNSLMKVCRLQNEVPYEPIRCSSLCQEIIKPKTRYVVICRNVGYKNRKGHYNCKKNIICKECVEKFNEMPVSNRKFDIIHNYFK